MQTEQRSQGTEQELAGQAKALICLASSNTAAASL